MSAIPHILTLAAVYSPTDKLPTTFQTDAQTVLDWVFGGAVLACIAGFIVAGVKLAHAHRQGSGSTEQVTQLVWVCVGCAVVGSASAIAGVFVT
ncbi:MAG: conjugal transfer protein TrbC [Solirubrobacteraceae bacterium]